MKFERGVVIAERLPANTEMIGEEMPLLTDASNNHIRDFLDKNGEHLKAALLEKVLCGH
jgi:hypothetical protein